MSTEVRPRGSARNWRGPVLAWASVAPLAVWAGVRGLGIDVGHPFVEVLAFTPYAGVAALFLLGALLGARQRGPALVAGLAVLVFAACLLPRGLGRATDQAGPALTVMSMNMWGGAADPDQIVALVRDRRVDVLAVQEFTPAAAVELAAAGLATLLPYGELHPTPGAGGSGLYSRFPLAAGAVSTNPGGFLQASAELAVPGAAPVRVVSVHPVPPNSAAWVVQSAAGLRGQPRGQAGPYILAGDFNATLDMPALRDLVDTGYADAAVAVGRGLVPTWPYAGNHLAITPKVTIDHVLVSTGIGVADFDAVQVAVTDHRAIFARLVLPVA